MIISYTQYQQYFPNVAHTNKVYFISSYSHFLYVFQFNLYFKVVHLPFWCCFRYEGGSTHWGRSLYCHHTRFSTGGKLTGLLLAGDEWVGGEGD